MSVWLIGTRILILACCCYVLFIVIHFQNPPADRSPSSNNITKTIVDGNKIKGDNVNSLKEGMSEKEVEAILGACSGNYCQGNVKLEVLLPYFIDGRKDPPPGSTLTYIPMGECYCKGWITNEGAIWIMFDRNGRLLRKCYTRVILDIPSWAKIRDRPKAGPRLCNFAFEAPMNVHGERAV